MKKLLTISMMLLFICCASKSNLIELDKDFLHPAEYDVNKYQTLAMGDIEYDEEKDSIIVKDIQAKITSSIFKSEKFDLVARSNLEDIISEHKLSSSGLINQGSATIIGEIIGAGILITGRLSKNSYTEDINTDAKSFFSSLLSGNILLAGYSLVNVERIRTGDYFLSFDIKFIDLNSAKIIYAKTFQFKSQKVVEGSLFNPPEKIDPNNLYVNCLNQLEEEFIQTIAPHNRDKVVGFVKHKSLPKVDIATKLLSVDKNDAIRMFQEMIESKDLNSQAISIAYYNLSKAYFFLDEYDSALKTIKDGLINTPKGSKENIIEENWDSYTDAIKKYKKLAAKLEEQIKNGDELAKEPSEF